MFLYIDVQILEEMFLFLCNTPMAVLTKVINVVPKIVKFIYEVLKRTFPFIVKNNQGSIMKSNNKWYVYILVSSCNKHLKISSLVSCFFRGISLCLFPPV